MNMGHPRLLVGIIHVQRTVIYAVVSVSRNFERTNENDGFKMTALEDGMKRMVRNGRAGIPNLSHGFENAFKVWQY